MTRISEGEREIILDILYRWIPGVAVKSFGSRTRNSTKKWSDLDLALMTDTPVPPAVMMNLKLDFSESILPWRVDLLDWTRASASFRESIAADLSPL